jgi:hypothetical protein
VRRIEFDHAFANAHAHAASTSGDGREVTRIDVAGGRDHRACRRQPALARSSVPTASPASCAGAPGLRVASFARRSSARHAGHIAGSSRDTAVFDFSTSDLRGYAWDFPTQVAGAPLVCRGVYVLHDGMRHDAGEAKRRIAEYLAARGLPPDAYPLKQFAEQGFAPGAEIARPRVLLAGEAAGIDIATGEGIGQAIEYGAVAGPYLARALAVDDLAFTDWRRTVDHHHLGLAVRDPPRLLSPPSTAAAGRRSSA